MAFPFITTLVLCAAQGIVLDRPPGLVIVGIFKNEAPNLGPWLDYYLNAQGAVAAILVDNGSTDDWQRVVAPFGDRVRVTTDGAAHGQVALYNKYALPLLKREFPPLPTAPPVAAADDADGDGGDAMDLDLGDMFELADAADAADDEAAADEAA